VDPGIYERVLGELRVYLERHGLDDVNQVVGTLEYPVRLHDSGESR
jgi:hypothetical protein